MENLVFFFFFIFIWGKQAKVITAKNEKEASEAELEASKMQVEAADAAEDAKNKINKSA